MNWNGGFDNKWTNMPARMNDGRVLSSWQPQSAVNEQIQVTNNITSNWNYREYLQTHGLEIMRQNAEQVCNDLGISPIIHEDFDSTIPRENTPIMFNGVGDDRRMPQNSDLKQQYITTQRKSARRIAPQIFSS